MYKLTLCSSPGASLVEASLTAGYPNLPACKYKQSWVIFCNVELVDHWERVHVSENTRTLTQWRVGLRLSCTYPGTPVRPPHSTWVPVCVWARVCEAVNGFYALLVSFLKDSSEPQREARLLPCSLDPIHLLKDVEWLQWGPVHWWALEILKSNYNTPPTLAISGLPWFLGNVVGQVEAHLW